MKKKKYLFLGVTLCAVFIVLLTAYMTTSYLIDIETADNIITIGNVEASIDESPFDPESVYPADAGTVIEKAPKVKNTGINDEYVFLTVEVPKKKVTFLLESGANTGKKDSGTNPRKAQIFKVLSGGGIIDNLSGSDVTFSYHGYFNSLPGWYLVDSNTTGADFDVYTFGYNKKLSSNEESIVLFDKIQLKSFIDEELGSSNNLSINVKAYAIQADNLNLSTSPGDYLTDGVNGQIKEIYNIVKNKAGA